MKQELHFYGHLRVWPKKDVMADIMRAAGFDVYVGRYSIRLEDLSHFSFQEYGGDLGDPQIEADADDMETLIQEATRVSEALAKAGLVHRFEIYEGDVEIVCYLHHGWPQDGGE